MGNYCMKYSIIKVILVLFDLLKAPESGVHYFERVENVKDFAVSQMTSNCNLLNFYIQKSVKNGN